MKKNAPRSPLFYGSLLILECLMWGIANAIAKIGFDSITPMWCLTLRYAFSAVLFLAFFGRRFFRNVKKKELPSCILVSIATASAFIFGFLSLVYTTATNAGFFMALAVIIAPFISVPLLKEKFDPRQLIPVVVVVAGMYLVGGGSFSAFGKGELFAVLSSCSTAFMLTLSGKYLKNVDTIVLSTVQCIVCFFCCLIVAFIMEGMPMFSSIGPAGWGLVLYLAIGCTFLAYLFQNTALSHVSPAFGALTWCTEPLFTAIAAFFILHERLTPIALIGCIFILAGTVLASCFEMKKPQSKPACEP